MKELLLKVSTMTILAVLAYLLLSIVQPVFTPFEYSVFPINDSLVPVDGNVGQEVSHVIWGRRQLDMIVLAFFLFVTATCCKAILSSEKSETS